MEKKCKIHGVHSEWKLIDRPSARRRGKGKWYTCRYCLRKRKADQRKKRLLKEHMEMIRQTCGEEAAERFISEDKPNITNYVYRGQGFAISRDLLFGMGKTARIKFFRLGEERAKKFLSGPTCEQCGLKHHATSFFDIHHILAQSNGGLNTTDNLIVLCPNCHREAHLHQDNPFGILKRR